MTMYFILVNIIYVNKKNSMKRDNYLFLMDLDNYGSCERKTRQQDEILPKIPLLMFLHVSQPHLIAFIPSKIIT